MYREVQALPAGTTMWLDHGGRPDVNRYVSIPDIYASAEAGPSRNDAREIKEELRRQLLDSVEHHLVADVPVPAASCIDEEAIAFAAGLRARWTALRDQVLAEAVSQSIDPKARITDRDRCISPSDFGIHNAIVTPAGKVYFLDFEYAGWDDPAKAISDFFCHPAVPVPFEYFDRFLAEALKYSDKPEQLAGRTRLLLRVFRIKWCCIVMNDFLPLFGQRRFAYPAINAAARKQAQLDKARGRLETVH